MSHAAGRVTCNSSPAAAGHHSATLTDLEASRMVVEGDVHASID